MAAARELVIADDPASWAALGFAPGPGGAVPLGAVGVRLAGRAAGAGLVALAVDGLARERPDGLPIVSAGPAPRAPAVRHPNGALAIDHAVVFTDALGRTTDALADAGGDVRRRGAPPELPAPMAFVRFGALIVEVAETGGPARFWGLTIIVADVDALAGPLLGSPRAAVQRGRRIATVAPAAGLSVALALISPRADSNPAKVANALDKPRPVG